MSELEKELNNNITYDIEEYKLSLLKIIQIIDNFVNNNFESDLLIITNIDEKNNDDE